MLKQWSVYFGGQNLMSTVHFGFAMSFYDEVTKIAEVLGKSACLTQEDEVLDYIEGDRDCIDNVPIIELVINTAFKKVSK